jgi:hypothetical protein
MFAVILFISLIPSFEILCDLHLSTLWLCSPFSGKRLQIFYSRAVETSYSFPLFSLRLRFQQMSQERLLRISKFHFTKLDFFSREEWLKYLLGRVYDNFQVLLISGNILKWRTESGQD